MYNKEDLKPLQGLSGLEADQKGAWIKYQVLHGALPSNYTSAQAKQLYKNKQYIDKFGIDKFKANPNYLSRNKELEDSLISDIVDTKYGLPDIEGPLPKDTLDRINNNYQAIKRLPSELQLELIEGGYMSEQEIQDAADKYTEERKKYSKWDASRLEDGKGMYITEDEYREQLYNHNNNLLSKANNKHSKELMESAQSAAIEAVDNYRLASIEHPEIKEQIDKTFDAQLSGGEREVNSPKGTYSVELPGSNYWKIFKDRRELEDLTTEDKVELLASMDYISRAENGGYDKALQAVDNYLQDKVHEGENVWYWIGDAGRGVAAKALASLFQGLDGFIMLTKLGNKEALQNYLEGKDENGEALPRWENLNYWNDVYQYNAFNPEKLDKIRDADGLSPYSYVTAAGNEYTSFAKIASEAAQQGGNALAQWIPQFVTGGLGAGAQALQKLGKVGQAVGKAGVVAARAASIVESVLPEATMETKIVYDTSLENAKNAFESSVMETAETYAEREVASGKYNEDIKAYVDYLVAEQDRLNAGKEDSQKLIIPREQFEQQAIEQLKGKLASDYYNTNKEMPEGDVKKAKDAALTGGLITFGIFAARGAAENLAFKSYLFDKGTRQLTWFNKTNRSIATNADGTLSQVHQTLNRVIAVSKEVLGGGLSEYGDSLSEGFAEGFALSKFNNNTEHRYSPSDYVEGTNFTSNFLSNMYAGAVGLKDAALSKDAFFEAAIGALGAATTLTPAQRGETKVSKDAPLLMRLNRYIKHPLVSAYYDEVARQQQLDTQIKAANKVISNHTNDIATIGNIIRGMQLRKFPTNYIDGKDSKERQAYDIISYIGDLMSSEVGERNKDAKRALNLLETLKKGKANNETFQQAVKDYLADNNLDATEDNIAEASKRLQKNATQLLDLYDKYTKIAKAVNLDETFISSSSDTKKQAVYNLVMDEQWKSRLSEIEKTIKGSSKYSTSSNSAILYPTLGALTHSLTDIDRLISADEKDIVSLKEEIDKLNSSKKTEVDKTNLNSKKTLLKRREEVLKNRKQQKKELEKLKKNFDSNTLRVLSSTEILNLNPTERAYMIDNKNLYSKEQQDEIAKVEDKFLLEDHNSSYLTDIKDAATLYERIQGNNDSYKLIKSNPAAFDEYVKHLKGRQMAEAITKARTRAYSVYEKNAEFFDDDALVDYTIKEQIGGELLEDFIKAHPDRAAALTPLIEVRKLQSDLFNSVDTADYIEDNSIKKLWKDAIWNSVGNARTVKEAMSSLEDLLDLQHDARAKAVLEHIISNIESLGYSRDATKIRDRAKEAKRKAKEEEKRKQKEAKKDGANYGWEGYKVGDVVYDTKTGVKGTVEAFEKNSDGSTRMLVKRAIKGGYSIIRLDPTIDKDKITKEEPKKEKPKEVKQPIISEKGPENAIQTGAGEVILSEDEGKVTTPGLEEQAKQAGVVVSEVPEDTTDQGNNLEDNPSILLGNKYVEWSITTLMSEHKIEEEVPEDENSIFGQFISWLHNSKIKLQEIIDEEFSKILLKNPDIPIHFMMVKAEGTEAKHPMQTLLINVIEYTEEVQKYHNQDRGGVIEANGKLWLVVGTTGFAKEDSKESRIALDTMRNPISRRRFEYFRNNPTEKYYVDTIATTKVQDTTSGRILNVARGEETPVLRPISEVLQRANKKLSEAQFLVQKGTNYAVTPNAESERAKYNIFPPKDKVSNSGRVFLLIDTPNGHKIPAMIEPAMFNNLKEGSPLKEFILQSLSKLASTSYSTRKEGIIDLCKLLVLDENQNILIGKEGKDSSVLTLRVKGFADRTYALGENFDMGKFLKDIESANFKLNISIQTLGDPDMLRMYNDSGALMTYAASMQTVGSSYSVYTTDANGKIIEKVPVGHPYPGTGKTEIKTYRTVVVNNTSYELKNGVFVDKKGQKVAEGTPLYTSCLYNDDIQNNNRDPYYTKGNLQYYLYQDTKRGQYLVTRDGLGNITILTLEESKSIIEGVNKEIEYQNRLDAAKEEVNLREESKPKPIKETPPEETLSPEELQREMLGEDIAAPSVETQKEAPQKEQPKESQANKKIDVVGTKSLEELQNSNNYPNFVSIISSEEYGDQLLEALLQKGWGITEATTYEEMASILEAHNVSLANIPENIQDWIDLIKHCR